MAEESGVQGDENLASILHDWWWKQPFDESEVGFVNDEAAAMADMRSLLAHLDEHGYVIVPKGECAHG